MRALIFIVPWLLLIDACSHEPNPTPSTPDQSIEKNQKPAMRCEFTCTDGESHLLFCGDPGAAPGGCSQIMRENGCMDGTSFVRGTCAESE